jgi:hypothetical protein
MAVALPLLGMDMKVDLDPRWRDDRSGWGPWIFGTRFMDLNQERYLDAFFAARLIVLGIGVTLGLLVFWKAAALLSPLAAVAVLVLYGSMPPLLAHSAVATLDVGVTALLFAAFVALERFARCGTSGWAAFSGALLGLAFAVKGVTALFVPVAAILVLAAWPAWDRVGIRRFIAGVMMMAASAWLAVQAAYGFSGFPLPASLIQGVRFQMEASRTGEFPAFLNGQWSQTGWWYYYLAAFALKTPIPTLILLLAGSAEVLRRPGKRDGLWIVLPPVFLLYVLSFHYAKDYGVRYLLPAFPFLLLLAGRGVDALLRLGKHGAGAVFLLLTWQTVECIVTAPHHLAYFNEFAGGDDRARHLLLDSNLDWGQDLGRLKTYLRTQGIDRIYLGYFGHVDPHLYGIEYVLPPVTPTPGRYAMSANFLAGYPYAITYAGEPILGVKQDAWSWLERFKPVARVGRSIYVFDVTPEAIAQVKW